MGSKKENIQNLAVMELDHLFEELDEAWARVRDHIEEVAQSAPALEAPEEEEEPDDDFEFMLPDFPEDDEEAGPEFQIDGRVCMLNEVKLEHLQKIPEDVETILTQVKCLGDLVELCPDAEKLTSVNAMVEDEPFNVLLLMELHENGKFLGEESIKFDAKELMSALEIETLSEEEIGRIEKAQEVRDSLREQGPDGDAPVPVDSDEGAWPAPGGEEEGSADEGAWPEPGEEEEEASEAIAEQDSEIEQSELDAIFGDPDAHRTAYDTMSISKDDWDKIISVEPEANIVDSDAVFEKYTVAQEELDALLSGAPPPKAIERAEAKAVVDVQENEDVGGEGAVDQFFGPDSIEGGGETMELPAFIEDVEQLPEATEIVDKIDIEKALAAADSGVDQDELDKLFGNPSAHQPVTDTRRLSQDEWTKVVNFEVSGPPITSSEIEFAEFTVDQTELDALFAAAAKAATLPAASTATKGAEENKAVGQSEIDAMLAEVDPDVNQNELDELFGNPTAHQPVTDKLRLSQDEWTQVVNMEGEGSLVTSGEIEFEEFTVSQDELDALFAAAAATAAASTAASVSTNEKEENKAVGQSEIDAMLAAAGGGAPAEEADADANTAVGQSEIDAMLAAAGGDAPAEEADADANTAVGQSEIDAMLAAAGGGGDDASVVEKTSSGKSSPKDIGSSGEDAVDQGELDALFGARTKSAGGANTSRAKSRKASSKAKTDELSGQGGASEASIGAVSQDDIDALLNAQLLTEPEPVLEEAVEEGGTVNQDDIDALLNAQSPAEPEPVAAPEAAEESGTVNQNDIDALLNAQSPAEPEPVAAPETAEESGTVNQDDIDALLNAQSPAEPEPVAAPETAEESGTVNQDDIDALLNAQSSVEPEPVAAPEPAEEGGAVNQADIDALLNTQSSAEPKLDEEAETLAMPVIDKTAVVEVEETATADEGGAVNQDDIDALLNAETAPPATEAQGGKEKLAIGEPRKAEQPTEREDKKTSKKRKNTVDEDSESVDNSGGEEHVGSKGNREMPIEALDPAAGGRELTQDEVAKLFADDENE